MAASAMTAPGGPTTPWKHIQPKPGRRRHERQQEGKCGNEKESPDREAWGGKRGVAGAERECRRRQRMGWT